MKTTITLLSIVAVIAVTSAVAVSAAAGGGHNLAVTSTIDGKKVLPQRIRWIAHPTVAPSKVSEVDYLIDGKLRWVEQFAPYNYASDDLHGHLNYLYTSWLTPGEHTFTARAKTTSGQTATDTVSARVLPAPAPPTALAGTWTRVMTAAEDAKSDPKYGKDNIPPPGKWRLVIDRVGIWELDPLGTGLLQAYSVTGNVLHSYSPIVEKPKNTTGAAGSIERLGNQVTVNGGVECDESGPFGTYHWSLSRNQLTLTSLHEPCGQRRAIYEGTWTRS
jgi:hypothetical protein